jgi:hypothetical protein
MIMPWADGYCFHWDVTWPHTLTSSHLNHVVTGPSLVANDAEYHKHKNIITVSHGHVVKPVAIETLRACCDEAAAFLIDNLNRLSAVTGSLRSSFFYVLNATYQFITVQPALCRVSGHLLVLRTIFLFDFFFFFWLSGSWSFILFVFLRYYN